MIQLQLSEEERTVLIELLENAHSDLRMEIADTDRKDFRDMLKTQKAVIDKVLGALRPTDDRPEA